MTANALTNVGVMASDHMNATWLWVPSNVAAVFRTQAAFVVLLLAIIFALAALVLMQLCVGKASLLRCGTNLIFDRRK